MAPQRNRALNCDAFATVVLIDNAISGESSKQLEEAAHDASGPAACERRS
jgi:hypothetical protein